MARWISYHTGAIAPRRRRPWWKAWRFANHLLPYASRSPFPTACVRSRAAFQRDAGSGRTPQHGYSLPRQPTTIRVLSASTHTIWNQPQGQQIDLGDALSVFNQLGYVREEDLASIPVLQSRPRYVVYSPLAGTPLPPDVVGRRLNLRSRSHRPDDLLFEPAVGCRSLLVWPRCFQLGGR